MSHIENYLDESFSIAQQKPIRRLLAKLDSYAFYVARNFLLIYLINIIVTSYDLFVILFVIRRVNDRNRPDWIIDRKSF